MPIEGSWKMLRLLVIARENEAQVELCESLARNGVACSVTSSSNGMREAVASQQPDILLFEIAEQLPDSETRELIQRLKKERHLSVMALIPREILNSVDGHLDVDDFLTSPYDARELILRSKRLLNRTGSMESSALIKCDGLVIDLTTCEVTVGGRIVELTFKEYELLKLLANHPRRVYTRDALLDKVWGYDYYGGDRTVDVHIRRLRSKIEDSSHTFIETVRNIGYRFRKDA
jgi:two-component system alkaline phosphatase synthesis response regulator PhoP